MEKRSGKDRRSNSDRRVANDPKYKGPERRNGFRLVDEVAKVPRSKKKAGLAVDAPLAAIEKALKKGSAVILAGVEKFGATKRKARTGRKP